MYQFDVSVHPNHKISYVSIAKNNTSTRIVIFHSKLIICKDLMLRYWNLMVSYIRHTNS
jgi:hypothetical protein